MKRAINIHDEACRCLLCTDAPCSQACKKGDPARAIRAIRFDNEEMAWQWVAACDDNDLLAAEEACIHYDRPLRIREMLKAAFPSDNKETAGDRPPTGGAHLASQPSLEIEFCGITCENPFFLASSAVCTNYEMVARAFEAGWAGVFYKTICLDDIREVSPRFG